MRQSIALTTLCLMVSLCACKGGDKSDSAGGDKPAAGTETKGEEKVLNLYTWADYYSDTVLENFTKATGIKVQVDTFDSNETLQAKLLTGAVGYDVIMPSDYTVTILARSGKLQKLDKSKLPNLVNIDEQFMSPSYDPGLEYSVPFMFGTSGLGYLTDKVTGPMDSWSVLMKPDPKYKGRISMLKDRREVFGAAFKYAGKSLNTTDKADLDTALALLTEQKKAADTLYNSENNKDLLAQGEIWISHGWSSSFAIVKYVQGKTNVNYVVPKEGSLIYMDTLAIPVGAPHIENAYVFLNYFLGGEASAVVSNNTGGSSPNKAARPFIRKDMLEDPGLYPPPEMLKKLEFLTDVGEATKRFDDAWTQLGAN